MLPFCILPKLIPRDDLKLFNCLNEMNDKQSRDFKTSYDGSIESEGDFDLTNESMESNCTIQSNRFHNVIQNKAESHKILNSHSQAEFDLINKRFYLQQIECNYNYSYLFYSQIFY